MKAIVTGGAGFIGSHVVDALVERGFKVHVIDNLCAGKKGNVNKKAKLHIVDIRDIHKIAPIIKGADTVFHLAALPRVQYSIENPIETHETNVNGTLNVLLAARDGGVRRVVYSASSSAYGDQKKMPLHEKMSAMPKSPYGLQKYIGELYCKLFSGIYDLETVALRYFNVYGPRLDPNGPYALVIGRFIIQRKANEPLTITGNGNQTRDFTHVSDVVRANLLAMESSKVRHGEVINIGTGRNISINELASLIGGPMKHIESRLEPKHTLADNLLAYKLLGWKPQIKIEDGVGELLREAGLV